MTEQVQYLTPAWRDEAEKRLKFELSPERMNFITSSMSNIYLDCPDGGTRYLFFRFEKGEFADLLLGEGEPPAAEFKISGQYDTFAKISRAELGSQRALMTGKLQAKIARATRSSLKDHKSSRAPPPRPTISRSHS